MNVRVQIRNIADAQAKYAQQRAAHLNDEIRELEKVTAKKKLELKTANAAHERLASFQMQIGVDYQCPRCWIEHEKRSVLSPVGAPVGKDAGSEDYFRCGECGLELSASA